MKNEILFELRQLFPDKIITDHDTLNRYSGSMSYLDGFPPDAIFLPTDEQEIIEIVDFCIKHKVPLIPYGSGTSVEGHTAAEQGGICLDMRALNGIIELNTADGYVVVQAGLAYNELNRFLEQHGFHFPVEAGWGATIGGMMATNASGAGAVDAGSMSKNILNCDVIVYEGERAKKIHVGTRSPKSSAGYNLLNLFIGSEGTLGIFTEITLKIRKNFTHDCTIICQFEEIEDAVNFVVSAKSHVNFRRAEFLDKLQTRACVAYSSINFLNEDQHTLLIELASNPIVVEEEVKTVKKYLEANNANSIKIFLDKASAEKIWMMRKNAAYAARQLLGPTKSIMVTDVSVPLSQLPHCIAACYKHLALCNVEAILVAHIGDGNFHFGMAIDPTNPQELTKAKKFSDLVIKEGLKAGGTCTGEHGIGSGKKDYLEIEHSTSLFLMRKIKQAFDPYNIFNPGKILNNIPSITKNFHDEGVALQSD